MARCRSCTAPMLWAKTERGKAIPIDAEDQGGYLVPAAKPDGNLVLASGSWPDTAVVRYLKRGEPAALPLGGTEERRFTSHFATCPDAAEHRRR